MIASMTAFAARQPRAATALSAAPARVLQNAGGVDETRLAQELALLAVNQDVTEARDRLGAHLGAARDLLAQGAAVGRRLEFLAREFNREADTLRAKAQHAALSAPGLALKAEIDRLRAQVQNVA